MSEGRKRKREGSPLIHSGEDEVEGNEVKLLSLFLHKGEMCLQKSHSIRPAAGKSNTAV